MWLMLATENLKTRVTPALKARVAKAAQEQLLTESIWLRRLVLRELRLSASDELAQADMAATTRALCSNERVPASSLYVRLHPDDRLLLRERAAARGMASATYVSVLVRSHLRSVVPLPKEELLALKQAISQLGAVGRNLNQIAHAVNRGSPVPEVSRNAFHTMLKICEGLRDHTKGLLKANAEHWRAGRAEL